MSTERIIHLLPLSDLHAHDGPITAASLQAEGFVHCSPDEATMLYVANAFYREVTEPMVALVLDPSAMTSPVRFEPPNPPSAETANILFPHVYGPIDRAAITEIRYARRDVTGTYIALERRPPTVEALDLLPHPEGGWYRETWRSTHSFTPHGYLGPRAAGTAIYYLLRPGEHSAWHRVRSDELWLWHSGLPLRLTLGGNGSHPDSPTHHVLGGDVANGQLPQLVVPAGCWQSAEPMSGVADEVLVSCVVSPGFDFDDFSVPD